MFVSHRIRFFHSLPGKPQPGVGHSTSPTRVQQGTFTVFSGAKLLFFYDSRPIFDIFRHKTRLFHGGIGVASPNAQHDSPQKMGQGRASMAGNRGRIRKKCRGILIFHGTFPGIPGTMDRESRKAHAQVPGSPICGVPSPAAVSAQLATSARGWPSRCACSSRHRGRGASAAHGSSGMPR